MTLHERHSIITERHIYWKPWAEPGLEHLHLLQTDQQVSADGLILRLQGANPLRISYQIRCNEHWQVREVEIRKFNNNAPILKLLADGNGLCTDAKGSPLPQLEGCIDVDISATPFTNSIAMRRLRLEPGVSADIRVAYISIPEMEIKPVEQRYTCLEIGPKGGKYSYEGLSSGFRADLPVDRDLFVIDYPNTFKRVWPIEGG